MSSDEGFIVLTEPRSLHGDSLQGSGSGSGPCLGPGPGGLSVQQNPGASSCGPHSLDQASNQQLQQDQEQLDLLRLEEEKLLEQIQRVEADLRLEENLQEKLNRQADVLSSLLERPVYLSAVTAQTGEAPVFDMKSRLLYQMDGGTALITFEEDVVAKKILKKKNHTVVLGSGPQGYRVTVEARPVQLVVPKRMEVYAMVCSRRVLVSNLPQMDAESLNDKLGFHFSKRSNGGGEVESCQVTGDTAVITFTEEGLVDGLVLREFHEVKVQNSMHQVRVTPLVNGEIGGFEAQTQVCSRTVLLTGIPDLLDQETLEDILMVHFQKESNGGGEVLQCLYNPQRRSATAVFSGRSL